jgi:hypothetical protein
MPEWHITKMGPESAQERERDYREHIARLTAMLDQAHQQNQRLLDMPRTTPPPRLTLRTRLSPPGREPTRGETPSARPSPATRPVAPLVDPRGDMRWRIVALLQEHPEGLTSAEMRPLLGVDKS